MLENFNYYFYLIIHFTFVEKEIIKTAFVLHLLTHG